MFKGQRDHKAESLGLRGSQSCALHRLGELLETLQAVALSTPHAPPHTQRCLPSASLLPKSQSFPGNQLPP